MLPPIVPLIRKNRGALAIGLAATLTLAAGPQRLPVLPIPAENRELESLDPARDGWESESFGRMAAARLSTIGEMIAGNRPIDASAMKEMAADGFTCGDLVPRRLPERTAGGPFVVRRGDSGSAPIEAKGSCAGPEGLGRALRELASSFQGGTDVRAEFQLTRIDLEKGRASTTARYHASGRLPERTIEQTATWTARWTVPPDGSQPRLVRLETSGFEEVSGRIPGGRLFHDVTLSVMGATKSFREQLLPGVDDWLARLEGWIESDGFGHHGIAVGDVNGDGLEDLFLAQMGGLPNLLYIQRKDGTVSDVSADAGIDWLERSRAALLIDLDNDGDEDLVVGTSVALLFMENDGGGRFAVRAGLSVSEGLVTIGRGTPEARSGGVSSAGDEGGHYSRAGDLGTADPTDLVMLAAADYDQDGLLDVYACAYHARGQEAARFPVPFPYHDATNGGANILIRNAGDWRFEDVTKRTGLDVNNNRFSFAASWEDFDNDGDQDLYVANDFGRNNLYRNDNGRFVDIAAAAGVEDIAAGMSVSWGDFDADGWIDLYVGNMFSAAGSRIARMDGFMAGADPKVRSDYIRHARGNSLFRNLGDGTFRDVSVEAGVTMGRWAWDSKFADVDNDGWEDILVANGYFTRDDPEDLESYFWRRVVARSPESENDPSAAGYAAAWRSLGRLIRDGKSLHGSERNCCFLNARGNGYADISAISGFDYPDDARAVAVTDWDQDGALDLIVVNRTGPRVRLLRNGTGFGRRWIAVRLQGRTVNRDAIGARVEVHLEGDPGRTLIRTLRAGDGYLSQSSKWIHVGLGDAAGIRKVVVRWPGASPQEFTGLQPDRRYTLAQDEAVAVPHDPRPRPALAPADLPATPPAEVARIFLSAPAPAPAIRYRDPEGKEADAGSLPPGPVLLTLWKSACEPCLTDLKSIASRREELRSAGVTPLALSVEGVAQEEAVAAAGTGFFGRIGLAGEDLIEKLEILQKKVVANARPFPLPTSILIDGDGLVAAIYKGPVPVDRLLEDLPALRTTGERRLRVAIPFPGRRQTRGLPAFFDYMDGIAQAYAEEGYPDEAVSYYEKVLRIQPGRIEARFGLASALGGLARTDEAIPRYREVLEQDPDHVPALNNLGFALASRGEASEAIALYRRALAIEPANVSTLNNLGDSLAARGDVEEAAGLYRTALEHDPDNAPALNNLAVALARQGKDEEAIGHYRRLLDLEPDNVPARINLGIALVRRGSLDEAVTRLTEAVELMPDYAEARYHLGLALTSAGREGEAMAQLTEAVRLRPDLGLAQYHLALLLARAGKIPDAVGRLSAAMGVPPDSIVARERLAWILSTHQDPRVRDGKSAVTLARAVCEATRNSEPAALDTLAAALAETGRYDEAAATARRAIDAATTRGDEEKAEQIRSRLKLYESGRPFREGAGGD